MADKVMPLTEAVEGYELFDQMKVQKGAVVHSPISFFVPFRPEKMVLIA